MSTLQQMKADFRELVIARTLRWHPDIGDALAAIIRRAIADQVVVPRSPASEANARTVMSEAYKENSQIISPSLPSEGTDEQDQDQARSDQSGLRREAAPRGDDRER